MINPYKEVNWSPSNLEKKQFGTSFIVGIPIIASLYAIFLLIKGNLQTDYLLPSVIASCGFLLGWLFRFVPSIATPFYLVWYSVSCFIGIIVSNFFMIASYYFIFTPIAFLLRITKTISFSIGRQNSLTYWNNAQNVNDLKRYYKQF